MRALCCEITFAFPLGKTTHLDSILMLLVAYEIEKLSQNVLAVTISRKPHKFLKRYNEFDVQYIDEVVYDLYINLQCLIVIYLGSKLSQFFLYNTEQNFPILIVALIQYYNLTSNICLFEMRNKYGAVKILSQ